MMNNQELHTSISTYMISLGWRPMLNNGSMVSWSNTNSTKKIVLPMEEFIEDEHALILYNKAIKILAIEAQVSFSSIHNKLQCLLSSADFISIRTSGEAVKHGKINLFSGSKALSAISSLIKVCAKTHATAKKGFKKRLEEHYLNCVNLIVPQGGSFVHCVEIELNPLVIKTDSNSELNNEIPNEPVNRSINVRLAKLLLELRDIEQNKISLTHLAKLGITERISSTLIDVFSDEVDNVEYQFSWCPNYQAPKLPTNTILFNRSHLEIFKKIKDAFPDTDSFSIAEETAHIDGFITPEEGDELSLLLKLKLNGRACNCNTVAKREVVEKIMAQISNDTKQSVLVSGKITKTVNGTQISYSLTEAKISASGSRQMMLL
jgi:hypothetical protein